MIIFRFCVLCKADFYCILITLREVSAGMKKCFDFLLKDKFNLILFILYFVIALICVCHHEIWRDEAQVWLVARDLNLWGIFDHVRNEGHPLLWYFLVFPFAKSGLPVFSMQLVSFVFMSIAAGVFLWTSPFNRVVKTTVIFSAGFLYFLTVISRNYSLIPLFLFLMAYYYPQQKEKPYHYAVSLALLAHTHILMCGFCTGMAVLFFKDNILANWKTEDKKKFIAPFLVIFLSLLSVVIYIATRPEMNDSVTNYMSNFYSNIFKTIRTLLINIYGQITFSSLIAGIMIFAAHVILFRKNIGLFFVSIFSIAYQFYVYMFVWQTSPEKAFTLLLVLLFCFWVVFKQKPEKYIGTSIVLACIFGVSMNLSYNAVKNDIKFQYSDAKRTAEFIENNIEKDAVLLSNLPIASTAVVAYCDKNRKFYSPYTNKFYTYEFYGKNQNNYKEYEIPETLKKEKVYFLFFGLPDTIFYKTQPNNKDDIIYKSGEDVLVTSENFWIIKAN